MSAFPSFHGLRSLPIDFNLFLKSLMHPDGTRVWSVAQVNAIPIGEYLSPPKLTLAGGAITIVMVWCWAFVSDYFQTRWLVVMAQAVIGFIPSIILAIWNVPLGAKYFACK